MRVLYVEDNILDADLARRALARANPDIQLDIATTVADAIDRLAQQPSVYECVLFDLNLPDADGLKVLQYIRENRLSIAVIAVTGSGDERSVIKAMKLGADDYIIKSDDYLDELAATIVQTGSRLLAVRHNKPIRVLYAEDDAHDALFTQRHLANNAPHIRIDIVNSSAEVLNALRAPHRYDVLLLDYRLDNADSLDLVHSLKQSLNNDIPVVLVTGRGSEKIAARALRSGVADYIIKDDQYLERLPSVLEVAYTRG
jgi:CheY-like chemotaxis protein